jgi:hypothetical protein
MNKKTRTALFVGIPIVAIALYFILSKKKPNPNPTQHPNPNPNPNPPNTTSGLDFSQMASDLYDNMNGCGTAWDDGASDGVLGKFSQLRTNADFDALVNAYGTKKISCWASSNFTGGLIGALQSELSDSEIEELNNVLVSNGVTKQIPLN